MALYNWWTSTQGSPFTVTSRETQSSMASLLEGAMALLRTMEKTSLSTAVS